MPVQSRRLSVSVGFASEAGPRPRNEDYVGACAPTAPPQSRRGAVAIVADGVGGHSGGRVAAESAVRGFLDAYYAMPDTLGVLPAASRALESINGWIHAQGRADPALAGMACTFSALALRRRTGHVIHAGDSRVYRWSEGRLDRLTADHVAGRGDKGRMLLRAVGLETFIKFDHQTMPLRARDRFLLCSDGVHGTLRDRELAVLLAGAGAPAEIARTVVDVALAAGGDDNATALVLDVLDVPAAEAEELEPAIGRLPLVDLPRPGDVVDGFTLGPVLSDGRYSRLFRAADRADGRAVALKFPHPRIGDDATHRSAFLREAWVATRIRHPGVGEIVEVSPERQTRLYSVMPFYEGETLEARLKRAPPVGLAEGVAIATKLARAVTALHRARVIHRDIKPDNVILLEEGGVRLIDLGVARVPDLEDFPAADVPGTPSYMAPELFAGSPGDEASDLFALGVTIHRMFTGRYPYGEVEPFQRPNFRRSMALTQGRPDLPAWLDVVLARAVAVEPAARYADVLEFGFELENGMGGAPVKPPRARALYDRNPLLAWKLLTAFFAALSLFLLMHR